MNGIHGVGLVLVWVACIRELGCLSIEGYSEG